MKDGLSSVATVVYNHPVTALIKPELFPDRLRDKKQMSDEFPVNILDAVNIPNMFFRHDQKMGRSLGIDVCECKGVFILMNKLCGDLFFYDLAEETAWIVLHIISPPRQA